MNKIYLDLKSEIERLKSNTKHFIIGKSTLGEDIVCFEIGQNKKKTILVQAGIHAREYITCFLLINVIDYLKNIEIDGRIFIIPLLNPDGVRICLEGYEFINEQRQREIVKNILKTTNKKLYKANANGVDLNVNFDCVWGKGSQNTTKGPDYQNFIGYYPNSESEVISIIDFTKKVNPLITLSYHSKGEVIYYGYENQPKSMISLQQKALDVISKTTGYNPIFTQNSSGGYKDYCIMKLNILGFTIEVANDSLAHPISLEQLPKIFRENKDVVINLLKIL